MPDKTWKKKKYVLLGLNGRGGPLTYSCIISSYLSEHANVSLLLPSYSKIPKISKNVDVIRVHAPPSIIKTFFLTFHIPMHLNTVKTINEKHPDVINILDIHPWYVLYWPFLKAKKKIVTINDPEIHSGEAGFLVTSLLRCITRFLLKRAERIVALSPSQVPVLKKLGYKQKIVASRLGNQFEFSKKSRMKKYVTESKTLLFFGRIKEYKGLSYLLQAMKKIDDEGINFKLIIAGEGDITPYKKQITALGNKIEIHIGYISDEKMSEYFQRTSFIVLPYIDATQTGIASIAYYFQTPLIATNVGSLSDVIIDGKTGFLIPPKNVNALADAIKKLLKNPSKAKSFGLNGKQFQETVLDWKKISEKLYNDIES